MTSNLSIETRQVSTKITKLTKILLIVLGIPISFSIPANTAYAVWAVLLFIVPSVACVYFSYICVDAFLSPTEIIFTGLTGKSKKITLNEIINIKRFRSRRNLYFYFYTTVGKFLVIAPMWGEERNLINDLYERSTK